MIDTFPIVSSVVFENMDKVQGIKYDIVIVDPAIVNSPGFLDRNRLNVLFSRAKSGFYVVGAYSRWQNMWMSDSVMLREFASQLRKNRKQWPGSGTPNSRFFDADALPASR